MSLADLDGKFHRKNPVRFSSTRPDEDMLDVTITNVVLQLRLYDQSCSRVNEVLDEKSKKTCLELSSGDDNSSEYVDGKDGSETAPVDSKTLDARINSIIEEFRMKSPENVHIYSNVVSNNESIGVDNPSNEAINLNANSKSHDESKRSSKTRGKVSGKLIILPYQRLSLNVTDFLISFQRFGSRRKKVLGWWRTSPGKPRTLGSPVLSMTMLGYLPSNLSSLSNENQRIRNTNNCSQATDDDPVVSNSSIVIGKDEESLEHRVGVTMLPLRVYLDPYLITFMKQLSEKQALIDSTKSSKSGNY